MKIDLRRTENERELEIGDIVITQCKSGIVKHYLLIDNIVNNDEDENEHLLIDLEFSEVRCYIPNDMIEDYIKNNLEETILEIIPSDNLTIIRKYKD